MIKEDLEQFANIVKLAKEKDVAIVQRYKDGYYKELEAMTSHELWDVYDQARNILAPDNEIRELLLRAYKHRKLKEEQPGCFEVIDKMVKAGLKMPSPETLSHQAYVSEDFAKSAIDDYGGGSDE